MYKTITSYALFEILESNIRPCPGAGKARGPCFKTTSTLMCVIFFDKLIAKILLSKIVFGKNFQENHIFTITMQILKIYLIWNIGGIEMYEIADMEQFRHLNRNKYLLADLFFSFQSQLCFKSYKFLACTKISVFFFLKNYDQHQNSTKVFFFL